MRSRPDRLHRHVPLVGQLRWFIRLRWIAAAVLIAAGLANQWWLGWYPEPLKISLLGGVLLAWNLLLRLAIRPRARWSRRRPALVALALVQIVADLGCLTVLVLWTGGTTSPVLGFFVFHMVITSLLLRAQVAYGTAAVSGVMLTGGLWLSGQYPFELTKALVLLGWMLTLLITVYLTSTITRMLRQHQRRVLRQSYRIRSMSRRLRRQQQAMMQRDKMAAMGQMAAGVAHEIANPLASMDSLLQLIQRKPDHANAQTVGKLREQIDRINRIVRELTHFAHPASQRKQRVSIDEVVGRALQLIRFDHRIRDVKMEIHRDLPAGPGYVTARPHALEQVLVNLILNALDAVAERPQPGLDVRVGQAGRECFVEVADNGHGISPEHMGHLFEPFFTTKAAGKGTGLGLAISYQTVRDHGGTIEVETSEKGSTFTVRLPAADSQN